MKDDRSLGSGSMTMMKGKGKTADDILDGILCDMSTGRGGVERNGQRGRLRGERHATKETTMDDTHIPCLDMVKEEVSKVPSRAVLHDDVTGRNKVDDLMKRHNVAVLELLKQANLLSEGKQGMRVVLGLERLDGKELCSEG
jgi:hypothetical protein